MNDIPNSSKNLPMVEFNQEMMKLVPKMESTKEAKQNTFEHISSLANSRSNSKYVPQSEKTQLENKSNEINPNHLKLSSSKSESLLKIATIQSSNQSFISSQTLENKEGMIEDHSKSEESEEFKETLENNNAQSKDSEKDELKTKVYQVLNSQFMNEKKNLQC